MQCKFSKSRCLYIRIDGIKREVLTDTGRTGQVTGVCGFSCIAILGCGWMSHFLYRHVGRCIIMIGRYSKTVVIQPIGKCSRFGGHLFYLRKMQNYNGFISRRRRDGSIRGCRVLYEFALHTSKQQIRFYCDARSLFRLAQDIEHNKLTIKWVMFWWHI